MTYETKDKLILEEFYSHGKLLLTGEYLVMQGACALALPINRGQRMQVSSFEDRDLCLWKVDELGQEWFSCLFNPKTLEIIETNDNDKAQLLIRAINFILDFNYRFVEQIKGKIIFNSLEFEQKWGFGSSSTFVNNLARWSKTEPYLLQEHLFGGSGYDIACADNDQPLFYQIMFGNKVIESTSLQREVKDFMYFVYLGQKQNSRESVQQFLRKEQTSSSNVETISEISRKMVEVKTLNELNSLIEKHEELMSSILGYKPIKESKFQDFSGQAKSLGAWGGDIALLTTDMPKAEIQKYLQSKDLNTLFTYRDLEID